MGVEELFNHFQYACYKRLRGVGLFDTTIQKDITFFYTSEENLFTDGEVLSDDKDLGTLIVRNPTFCISGVYFDSKRFKDPTKIRFEVYLKDDSTSTIEAAETKLRELSKKVHFREKKFKEQQSIMGGANA